MESMDQARYRELSFEQLKEQDLPLMYSWLQEPHVREFYHRKGVSLLGKKPAIIIVSALLSTGPQKAS